jgi:hypothetical protein
VVEKSEALRATIGKFAQELRAKEQEDADTAQICDSCKEFAAEQHKKIKAIYFQRT